MGYLVHLSIFAGGKFSSVKNKITYLLFLCLITLTSFAQDEVSFTAVVSKNTLGVNQRLKIEYTINQNGADNFKAPNFDNFKVVAGPSSSVSQSWINGKSTFSQSYIYFIEPKAKGTFTIPPASIEYKGNIIKSNAVEVIVTDKVELPKDPNDPKYLAQENIHLVAHVSKTNPFLGEAIYVEYRLYFSKQVGFYNTQFNEIPKYEGFWNQEISIKGQEEQTGEYQGKSMRYYTLKKMLLIPQKTGKLYVEPMDMEMVVSVPTGRYDFFGHPQTRSVNARYTSNRKLIQVKDLPSQGKPADFSGAVGNFDLSVTTSKANLKANESTQVNVKVSGKGNLKLFDLPELQVPAELEVYTPERKQSIQHTYNGLSGYISDNYSIVPEYKGKYIIPAIQFTYFNPTDKKYYTKSSDEIILHIEGGKEFPGDSKDTFVNKHMVVNKGENFKYISTETQFTKEKTKDFLGSKWYYSLILLSLISIPLGVIIKKKRDKNLSDVESLKSRKADKLAKKYLTEAKKKIQHKEAFYIALEKAMHNFLKAVLKVETSDISQENIAKMLQERHISENTIKELNEVWNDCNLARYAPTSMQKMKASYDLAKNVISTINTQIR